jgi:hypothetical protein
MGRSALDAGVMLAIMSLSWTLTSMLVGRSLRIISWRAAALAGGGALLLGSLALPMLMPGADLLWARLGAFLIGAGMGMCNTTFIVSVQNSADYSIRGIATASTSFMRMLGSSVGTALLGAVLNRSLAYRLPGVAEPVQALMDPVRRAALPAQEIARIATGVASAMHGVFWAACAFGVAAVLVARLVPRGVK